MIQASYAQYFSRLIESFSTEFFGNEDVGRPLDHHGVVQPLQENGNGEAARSGIGEDEGNLEEDRGSEGEFVRPASSGKNNWKHSQASTRFSLR